MKNDQMPSLAHVDLNLLVLFEALLSERNVTRAAVRVGLAQPSASKALDRLRHLFGDPLFLRAPGGMRPTPRALELAPEIALVLERVRALVAAELPFDPATARGSLRLAMSDAAEFVLLPGLVAQLAGTAPGVTLQARPLDKDRVFAELDEGRLDAVVGVFRELPKRFRSAPLFEERFVCLARADHPRLATGLTLETYVELPHLLVTLRDDRKGAVDDALEAIGLHRRVAATLTRFLALPPVLAFSDAIATVPSRFAAASAPNCRLHEPPLALPRWTEQLVWRAGAEREPMIAWGLQLIRSAGETQRLPPAFRA
ncbi:Putative transcriptional regulatory protein, LysR-family [Bradyrhizobium sp. ORS 278]|nr:Putative transcriptional regulatory protein, LysR-family [Bradyrhizobium sp. ORS 278]